MGKTPRNVETVGDLLEQQPGDDTIKKGDTVEVHSIGNGAVALRKRDARVVAQVTQRPASPMEMIAAAIDKGMSIEVIERLMVLQERMAKDDAYKQFCDALTKFKAIVPKIDKNKGVGFESKKEGGAKTSYRHATLDNITDIINGPLSECGLAYRWRPAQQNDKGEITVTCILTHVSGYAEDTTLRAQPDNTGNKNSIQAVGSTVTYLQRYTLTSALGLSTGDDDDGKQGGAPPADVITPDQIAEIQELLDETKASIQKFCELFHITALAELKRKDFTRAIQTLEQRKKDRAQKPK